MSSFRSCALSGQPLRPVSARSGRKESLQLQNGNQYLQVDAVLPADTVAA